MIIIGVDYHPEFQQIALLDQDTGELPVFATHAASLLDEREQWCYHPQPQPKPTPALSKESHGVRRLCRSSTTL
jgi:hypothetical protein